MQVQDSDPIFLGNNLREEVLICNTRLVKKRTQIHRIITFMIHSNEIIIKMKHLKEIIHLKLKLQDIKVDLFKCNFLLTEYCRLFIEL